ncbi:regulator of G protein signaling domain protein [Ancylostoma ceylanicum]|uniref:Regulator of G protein signaling domain protein n=1 Tax=Ancylostoma ceylanicum TaxID=53326 RepID=A0A0D6MCN1_9BILA|nr:regulator of G protein signaling domain protein [Ancylostoma ceylanicum]
MRTFLRAATLQQQYEHVFARDNKTRAFSVGQKYFAEFLKGEYSDENILFWQACEELKREKNAEKIEEKARIIYEDFISILSPKEVSLDSRVREIVNTNMSRPSSATFDEAQNQIYTLMQRDSYPSRIPERPWEELGPLAGL